MRMLKENVIIPLGRMYFIPKEDGLKAEDLIVETVGKYRVIDKPDCIAVYNEDCCKSIKVTIKIKD